MKQRNGKKNPGEILRFKLKDKQVNYLVLAAFAGLFIFSGIAIMQKEKKSYEKEDKYLEKLPSLTDTLKHSNICMATDFYITRKSIPFVKSHKTYYYCRDKEKSYFSLNDSFRFAIDPISKSKVDKAAAIVMLHPDRNGKVVYFGTTDTYMRYLQALKNYSKK